MKKIQENCHKHNGTKSKFDTWFIMLQSGNVRPCGNISRIFITTEAGYTSMPNIRSSSCIGKQNWPVNLTFNINIYHGRV